MTQYVPVSRVVLAVAVVVLACVVGAGAVEAARRTGNRLHLVIAAGAFALVCGIVGQRSWPTDGTVARLGRDAAEAQPVGPWDAGISLPLVGVHVTPVAIGGLLVLLAGVSLVLFLEPARPHLRPAPETRRLEDDDSL